MPSVSVYIKQTVHFDALRLVVPVRYKDEDMPYEFPYRRGDTWKVMIDLGEDGTAKIRDWPGPAHDLEMKVTDTGTYTLLSRGSVVTRHDDYVPSFLGEYGDYLKLSIAADGTITSWDKRPDYTELFPKHGE